MGMDMGILGYETVLAPLSGNQTTPLLIRLMMIRAY